MSNVPAPRLFVAPADVVPPTEVRSVALIQQKPVVSANQDGALIKLSDVAEHDRALATTLRDRLDFRDVLEGGSRLSAADAHGVLNSNQYERFEVIRAGLLERDRLQTKAKFTFRGTLGAVGLALGAAACFTSIPGEALFLVGLFGGGLGTLFGALAAEEMEKSSKHAAAKIPGQLLAIPPPHVAVDSAKADHPEAT